MLHIVASAPSVLKLEGLDASTLERVKKHLTYRDKAAYFEYQRVKKSQWMEQQLGDQYPAKLAELKAAVTKCLLREDESGLYTYSGVANDLRQITGHEIVNETVYPKASPLRWRTTPPDLRPYQVEAKSKLLAGTQEMVYLPHGAVSIGTGLGKSFIIMHLCRELGQYAVVMVPSVSIATQMYKDFVEYLGERQVGIYGGGKKKLGKRITICVAASLARVEHGSPAWEHFSRATVFIADESHMTPASTLANVCMGLCASAPYRFFFSGTQVRGDGADLLLQGIIGGIVYSMTVREGVDQGWLAKPNFKMVQVQSKSGYESADPNRMTRCHLYYNDNVNALAADFANKAVTLLGHPVLILVDEFEQFSKLLPYLRVPVKFAHGEITPENKKLIPEQFHASNPTELVEEFNRGELPVLVGTSCITTGTDVRSVKTMIFLRGGKSEVDVKQSVGRGTRLHAVSGKTEFNMIDFDVTNVEKLHAHAAERVALYDEIYGPVQFIDMEAA